MSSLEKIPESSDEEYTKLTLASEVAALEIGSLINDYAEMSYDMGLGAAIKNSDALGDIDSTKNSSIKNACISIKSQVIKNVSTSMFSGQENARCSNESALAGLNTTLITFDFGIDHIIKKLDQWDIDLHVESAFKLVNKPTEQQEVIADIKLKYPEFGMAFDYLTEKSYLAASEIANNHKSDNYQPNENSLASAFQKAAYVLYFSVAGALGLTDKVKGVSKDVNSAAIPSPYNLYELVANNTRTNMGIFNSTSSFHKIAFDAKTEFKESVLTQTIFSRLIGLEEIESAKRVKDADNNDIQEDGYVQKEIASKFGETCFAILNTFYSSSEPEGLLGALQSMDQEIVFDSIDKAYERAKAITWGGENDEKDKKVIDKYPLLSTIRKNLEQYSSNMSRNGMGIKKNSRNAYYHGGMAALLTIAWYVEQANPNNKKVEAPNNVSWLLLSEVEIQALEKELIKESESIVSLEAIDGISEV